MRFQDPEGGEVEGILVARGPELQASGMPYMVVEQSRSHMLVHETQMLAGAQVLRDGHAGDFMAHAAQRAAAKKPPALSIARTGELVSFPGLKQAVQARQQELADTEARNNELLRAANGATPVTAGLGNISSSSLLEAGIEGVARAASPANKRAKAKKIATPASGSKRSRRASWPATVVGDNLDSAPSLSRTS